MKYFKLSGSSDPKVIGVKNGVHQGEIKWEKFERGNSETIISKYFLDKIGKSYDQTGEINFTIEYVEAYKSSKMTDFFMFTPALYGINFFVSNKAMDVLCKYRLPVNRFIPTKIYHKEILHNYWAFYVPQFYDANFLDFEKCVFNQGTLLHKEYVSFKDPEQYRNAGYVSLEKLVFNSTIDTSLDLFQSSFLHYSYLISGELKSAIEEAGLTGSTMGTSVHPQISFE